MTSVRLVSAPSAGVLVLVSMVTDSDSAGYQTFSPAKPGVEPSCTMTVPPPGVARTYSPSPYGDPRFAATPRGVTIAVYEAADSTLPGRLRARRHGDQRVGR